MANIDELMDMIVDEIETNHNEKHYTTEELYDAVAEEKEHLNEYPMEEIIEIVLDDAEYNREDLERTMERCRSYNY